MIDNDCCFAGKLQLLYPAAAAAASASAGNCCLESLRERLVAVVVAYGIGDAAARPRRASAPRAG